MNYVFLEVTFSGKCLVQRGLICGQFTLNKTQTVFGSIK
jgi:hypothetical protein